MLRRIAERNEKNITAERNSLSRLSWKDDHDDDDEDDEKDDDDDN